MSTTPSGRMSATPFGSITDVRGVRVGHHQRSGRGWQTGTTVVFVPDGATPGVSVRGGGPGTRETDALRPENLVELIHAVCLTGGSAFGLAAADGVVGWLEEQGLGFPVGGPVGGMTGVVPVVPAAVVFDLGRGGDFANRPDAGFGRRAVARARRAQRSWGSVGAGTGAKAGGLQGGVGTAGTTVTIAGDVMGTPGIDARVSVGAVAVVNANGSPIDPSSGLPWTALRSGVGPRPGVGLDLRRPSAVERRRLLDALDGRAATESSLNTTIGVVATSAALTKSEVSKMADVAHDGLARAIRPAHSLFDGDTVFGLATGDVDLGREPAAMRSTASRQRAVNQLLTAAADMFEIACAHAVIAAERRGDLPSYADLCPSAFHVRSLT
jgi:L-aminopeptidase/D-esterase-like protein